MKRKVLYLEGNVDGTVGGSYYVMFDLVTALDKDRYEPVVGFHTNNFLVPMLREAAVETHIFDNPKAFSFTPKALNLALFPIRKTINFFRKLLLPALRYARFIRDNDIDLVNVNNSVMVNHTWMLAAMLTRTPCITHEMAISTHFSILARYFAKRLGAIICVSNAVKDNMSDLGLDYPNIVVIHNGLDLDRYHVVKKSSELRNSHKIGDADPVIGVVGNIKKWKGQKTIVLATSQLTRKYPNIKCLLVGAEPPADITYGKDLITLCRDLKIEDNVIFTGFQNNPIDYMNIMDIVVHTSVEAEPFGIVLLEAMLLSKPLVSTTIGGPAEIVIDKTTGLLVEPGNPELLAKAVDELLCNPEYARQLGQNGYDRLRKVFSIETNVKMTMAVYDTILSPAAKED